eukprot:GILJ01010220.1.p1 GENE.GILJ01010220.1~~GILJ01010220.1.p1  ORF type:complete len:171 (-),score=30.08 GILJ01010220.1:247-759(-)
MSNIKADYSDPAELLKADHRLVEQLFNDIKIAKDTATERGLILNRIIEELTQHASVEEKYLYPLVRRRFPSGAELAERSILEHTDMKRVLGDLCLMDPSDNRLWSSISALIAYVTQHVEEEERDILDKLKDHCDPAMLQSLAHALLQGKDGAPVHPARNLHPHVVGGVPL